MQTNVHDWSNIAPRIGIAWAPGSRGGRTGKTVIRGGFGMFYDRIDSDLTLDTYRFNGLNQQQLIIDRPDFLYCRTTVLATDRTVGSADRACLRS